jgi:hypothetical protein
MAMLGQEQRTANDQSSGAVMVEGPYDQQTDQVELMVLK